MSAFLLKGKRIARFAAGILSVVITAFAFLYAGILNRAQIVDTGKNFYFLVSDFEHVEVGAQVAQLQGGAGYALTCAGDEYAAYAVYFSESESEAARVSVAQTGERAKTVALHSNPIYLKSTKQKQNAAQITGAFESLYGCMQVLNNETKRLERGATQESSKRILQTLSKQFSFLGKEYAERVTGYESVCKNAGELLLEMISDVVYSKDLRYLLCKLSVDYTDLSKNFSL